MVSPIYADQTAYDAWVGVAGDTIPAGLFRAASAVVDEALIGAWYSTNSDDMPIEAKVVSALSDATCAQVQWMDATGDTTGAGDVREVQSASIGSVSFSNQTTTSTAARLPSGRELAPAAVGVLRVAGLLPITVMTRG